MRPTLSESHLVPQDVRLQGTTSRVVRIKSASSLKQTPVGQIRLMATDFECRAPVALFAHPWGLPHTALVKGPMDHSNRRRSVAPEDQ